MKKLLSCILALSIVGGLVWVGQANAAPSAEVIGSTCRVAQSTMGQVEKADLVFRHNGVRNYNSVLNLMFAMNSRLSSNKITAAKLSDITAKFELSLNTFRDDYNQYDDQLITAIQYDCTKDPSGFYNSLEIVRKSRAALRQNVIELDNYMNTYYDEFSKLATERKW